jgi:hypothetical protein
VDKRIRPTAPPFEEWQSAAVYRGPGSRHATGLQLQFIATAMTAQDPLGPVTAEHRPDPAIASESSAFPRPYLG